MSMLADRWLEASYKLASQLARLGIFGKYHNVINSISV